MTWITKPPLGTQLDLSHPLNHGLTMFLLFNENGGDKVYDISGNGIIGTVSSSFFPPTSSSGWNPGRAGYALVFDGSNDNILLPSNIGFAQTESGTLSITINTGSTKDFNRLFGYSNSANNFIYIDLFGVTRQITLKDNGGDIKNWVDNTLAINTWYNIVITKDASNWEIYVNGISEGTSSVTGSNGNLNIDYIGYANSYYFNGFIDEVRRWNRTLPIDQIRTLYSEPYSMFLN